MPEITINSKFGHAIYRIVRSYSLQRILEIGSFDGDGSTQVLIRALEGLSDPRLVCLEMRKDRFSNLLKNTANKPWVQAVNASSVSWDAFTGKNFDRDIRPYLAGHAESDAEVIKAWWQEDIELMKNGSEGFLESTEEFFDAVLIDGGEFTGYDEFVLMKKRTDCFFLDDVFRAYKCRRAFEELSNDPAWAPVFVDRMERHGTAAFVRKSRRGGFLHRAFRALRGNISLFKLLCVEKLRRDFGFRIPG